MKRSSHLMTVLLCGVAGLALAVPAAAKDKGVPFNPGGTVEFKVTVDAVREVPAGNPFPGMHLDVKVEGRATDVYIAPMDFCAKFDIRVLKGDEVFVVGNQMVAPAGSPSVVLAREISLAERGAKSMVFRPTLTVFLRNDDGPFWIEPKLEPKLEPKPTD